MAPDGQGTGAGLPCYGLVAQCHRGYQVRMPQESERVKLKRQSFADIEFGRAADVKV